MVNRKQPFKAAEEPEEVGLIIFDSSAKTVPETGTGAQPSRLRGPKRKPPIQRDHDNKTGDHRQAAKGTFCKKSSTSKNATLATVGLESLLIKSLLHTSGR